MVYDIGLKDYHTFVVKNTQVLSNRGKLRPDGSRPILTLQRRSASPALISCVVCGGVLALSHSHPFLPGALHAPVLGQRYSVSHFRSPSQEGIISGNHGTHDSFAPASGPRNRDGSWERRRATMVVVATATAGGGKGPRVDLRLPPAVTSRQGICNNVLVTTTLFQVYVCASPR